MRVGDGVGGDGLAVRSALKVFAHAGEIDLPEYELLGAAMHRGSRRGIEDRESDASKLALKVLIEGHDDL